MGFELFAVTQGFMPLHQYVERKELLRALNNPGSKLYSTTTCSPCFSQGQQQNRQVIATFVFFVFFFECCLATSLGTESCWWESLPWIMASPVVSSVRKKWSFPRGKKSSWKNIWKSRECVKPLHRYIFNITCDFCCRLIFILLSVRVSYILHKVLGTIVRKQT